MTLRGHFDGKRVVLDEPIPDGIAPATPVEIVFNETELDASELLTEIAGMAQPGNLPPDYSEQHDHYIKGTPRR